MTTTQNKIYLELTPSDVEQILWQLQIAANETGCISTADWFVDKCGKHGVVFYRDGNGTMRAKLPPPKTKQDKQTLNRLNILKKQERLAEAMGDTESAEFYKKLRLVEMIEFNACKRTVQPDSSIKQRAVDLITKIQKALVVCNLRDYNRDTRIPGYLMVLTYVCFSSHTCIGMNKYLNRYDKVFTRLLKGKPSIDEWSKMMTRIDIGYILND